MIDVADFNPHAFIGVGVIFLFQPHTPHGLPPFIIAMSGGFFRFLLAHIGTYDTI